MNYKIFIAWRYLFSRKSHHAINIISAISACGVAIATLAMVCTLSVFNGFHSLVADLFTDFDPQLKVTLAEGRTLSIKDKAIEQLRRHPDVDVLTLCLEDQALVVRDGKQTVVTVKGMDDNFDRQLNLPHLLYPAWEEEEELALHADVLEYCIPGIQLAIQLGLRTDFDPPLQIFAPKRGERVNMANPLSSFNNDELLSSGYVFQVKQTKYDANYLITSLQFAQHLFDQEGRISQAEIRLRPGTNISRAQRDIANTLGSRFVVQDRYEQQEDVFRIMKIEKLLAYVFLTFILFIASFNIIGSLSMLMIDKQRDIQTLHNLGAPPSAIRLIFTIEGNMISMFGALAGIGLGVLLCWVQQHYGIVSMGQSEGSFIVEAYPVVVKIWDLVLIFLTVMAVSALVVWYPVRRQNQNL
ncbi:MAG: ABC transporter permease [Bacteroidaceae bacterium]|nr:ABC transporter permease [Bacteroidaceae bacterium]